MSLLSTLETAAAGLLALSALSGCWREPAARFPAAPEASPAAETHPDDPQAQWSEPRSAWRPPVAEYPLDSFDRTLSRGQLSCPAVDVHDFPGHSLRFSPPARVIEPFRQRLLDFEQVVREVSQRVYARPPSAILVAASHGCRSVGGANRKLSEHALGNAIDITGFEFALPPGWEAWSSLPAPLGRFEVRVDRHWKASGDAVAQRHAYFLDELTRELVARGIFRTLLGPAQPDHSDHFHFDMAPWSYVNL